MSDVILRLLLFIGLMVSLIGTCGIAISIPQTILDKTNFLGCVIFSLIFIYFIAVSESDCT